MQRYLTSTLLVILTFMVHSVNGMNENPLRQFPVNSTIPPDTVVPTKRAHNFFVHGAVTAYYDGYSVGKGLGVEMGNQWHSRKTRKSQPGIQLTWMRMAWMLNGDGGALNISPLNAGLVHTTKLRRDKTFQLSLITGYRLHCDLVAIDASNYWSIQPGFTIHSGEHSLGFSYEFGQELGSGRYTPGNLHGLNILIGIHF